MSDSINWDSPAAEAKLNKMAAQEFNGHRPLPDGRNFVFWEHTENKSTRDAYRSNFDLIRWDSEQRCPTEAEL